jgi:hypothetical protein
MNYYYPRAQAKLTQKETEKLSSSFEMCVFTHTYSLESRKSSSSSSGPIQYLGKYISRSTKFLVDMILEGIHFSREKNRKHFVRLSRNMISTLVTAMTKLKQDEEALEKCEGCGIDKEVNLNDRIGLMGVTQFILHGISSLEPSGSVPSAYEGFYKAHSELIVKKVTQLSES